jgi:CheY-like chemotaxis protein
MEKPTRPYRILVVDDNPEIHEDFKKILIHQDQHTETLQKIKSELFDEPAPAVNISPYELNSAYQGEEAVQLVKEAFNRKDPYALIFLDVVMPPGINGIETAKAIWEIDPYVQIVICTAYSDYSWNSIVKELGINDNFLILKKPFESIEIRQFAACLTAKWSLGQQAGQKFDRLYSEIVVETAKLKKMMDKRENKEI